MGDSKLLQLASNESLVSELEAREKRAPLQESLRDRLATLIGPSRFSVKSVLSDSPAAEGQARAVDLVQEVRELSPVSREALLVTLRSRFERTSERFEGIEWGRVRKALEANPKALWSIQRLEESGGEPEVFKIDKDGFEIGDAAKESPVARRDISYDNAAFMAEQWGVELMSKEQYEHLHSLGRFDSVTQSWLRTHSDARGAGGGLCGYLHNSGVYVGRGDALDQREDRGFRCALRVEWVKEKERISFWRKLIK